MKNYKKVAAVVITAVAISGSATALASASSAKIKSSAGVKVANKEAVVTATLGIDAATLRSRLEAGESLAVIAGAKKDALIAALVAEETKQIDAAVTAGKLTAAQASTLKSNLTAHVTEEVNKVRVRGMHGSKHGGKRDGFGRAEMQTVITTTLGIDATTLRNRLTAGETLAAIAGSKKDALVAALVAEHTKRIDAAVSAGKLTAEQAKSLKDNLSAHITEEINEVHTPGMGGKGKRGGHGPGHDHGMGKGMPETSNTNY